ncbi:MAG: nascent polypeptide-associated complex protein [Candidatus Marsarchaeota archaeon]|nr:nascent polypeptide-associated complex protein [Candidatus Marsarchaeota archaeon]
MMPNMDPRALKSMMARMGIKSTDIKADRVIIESGLSNIVIENPNITKIEAQGTISFQISGDISEEKKSIEAQISNEDIEMVMQKTGVKDRERVELALEESGGDIAEAIIKLTE